MRFKMFLICVVFLVIGCGGTPFATISGFTIENINKTSNGRCVYSVECQRPLLSCEPMFLDECNRFKVGDKVYLTLKQEK